MAPRPRFAARLAIDFPSSSGPGSPRTARSTRHAEWERWYLPIARVRRTTALWHAAAWATFGAAFVGAIVFVASGLDAEVGSVVLVLVAGGRLSAYVGSAVQELGFLRGIWLDSSQRLAWLEDYAASKDAGADLHAPDVLRDGVRFEHVSFTYPGTERLVLDDVDLHLPAGTVVASTTNGSITGSGLSGGVEARSTNGNITVGLTAVSMNPVELRATNGAIALTLPPTADANIDASCTNGSIEVQGLALERTGEQSERRTRGRLNAGGAPVQLSSTNGSIRISAAP